MSLVSNATDQQNLVYSGRILGSLFVALKKLVVPGTKAKDIDDFVYEFTKKYDAVPAFKGYKGYPYHCNFSIDSEVTHAFPSPHRIVPDSGVLKIDIGVSYKGMITDRCVTYVFGNNSSYEKLSSVCYDALFAAIAILKPGIRTGDIGSLVDSFAKQHSYGNVYNLGGHGVGYKLHDEPFIPHFGKPGKGNKLFKHSVITIEPMFTLGSGEIEIDQEDHWTIRTADSSIAVQWEHTLLITDSGCRVITDVSEDQLLT